MLTTLTKMREDSEKSLKTMFEEISKLGKSIHGIPLKTKQTKNPGTTGVMWKPLSTDEYFRI